jgi:hypothetical protein
VIRARRSRAWPVAAMLVAMLGVTLLGGCELPQGKSGVEAELSRVRGEQGFAVVAASPSRAVFAVRGQRIVVEPPEGYCLDEGSIAVSAKATFALVADCMLQEQQELKNAAAAGANGETVLPHTLPGILTVSISGRPAYGSEPGALDAFETLLRSEAGLELLGRGVSDEPGRIVAVRRIDGALYVLIHEPVDPATSILAPNFWRAFLEVKDRLMLVTVSCFMDRPLAEDAMMSFLARQMSRLRRSNGLEIGPEEERIAKATVPRFAAAEPVEGPERPVARRATGRAVAAAASGTIAPDRAPLPRERFATAQGATSEGSPAGGTTGEPAPARAPVAPVRPG